MAYYIPKHITDDKIECYLYTMLPLPSQSIPC